MPFNALAKAREQRGRSRKETLGKLQSGRHYLAVYQIRSKEVEAPARQILKTYVSIAIDRSILKPRVKPGKLAGISSQQIKRRVDMYFVQRLPNDSVVAMS